MIKKLLDRVVASRSASSTQGETMTLGGVEVEAKPLTPAEFDRILARFEALPSVALSLTSQKSGNVAEWAMAAWQVANSEFYNVVAEASGLDVDHIRNKAYLTTEIIPYVVRLFEVNRLPDEVAKKLRAATAGFLARKA